MSNVARDLSTTTALDDNGAKVPVGGFWADRKAVVVMIRYFDSASCRKLVATMRDATSELETRGAVLAVIGAGQPDAMREFRESVGYRGPFFVDPSLDAFRLAGMVPGAVTKPAAATVARPSEQPIGFFGKMKAAMNADVGKLLKMDVKQALTTDLVKLGQEHAAAATPAASGGSGVTTSHDSGVFVLGPGPTTAFEWRAKATGELPKLPELLAALPKK